MMGKMMVLFGETFVKLRDTGIHAQGTLRGNGGQRVSSGQLLLTSGSNAGRFYGGKSAG